MAGNRQVTGKDEPAKNGNFNRTESSTISLHSDHTVDKCLSLNTDYLLEVAIDVDNKGTIKPGSPSILGVLPEHVDYSGIEIPVLASTRVPTVDSLEVATVSEPAQFWKFWKFR